MPDIPAEAVEAAAVTVPRDIPLLERSDDELRRLNNGCTELSCMYHGAINRELMQRAINREEANRA